MLNLKRFFLLASALFCVVGFTTSTFNLAIVGAQSKRPNANIQNGGNAPLMNATLTDAFADADGNGRAQAGEEITYTATIFNNGNANATNVNFTNPIDGNSTLVADSVQVQPDQSSYVIRCVFDTSAGGSGGCTAPSSSYKVTDANLNTIIGGQFSNLNFTASNVSYNAGTRIFQFDAVMQNLLANALGSINGSVQDAAGVRLFLNNATVTSAAGISVANGDGAAQFTALNQPFFQYNEIIQPNQTSSAKTLQFNVPNTVTSFTVDFLVSTKAEAKLVINEVLSNPGGVISDANGEWFELYNAGSIAVDLKNFLINDFANAVGACTTFPCARPSHTIASSVTIQPGGYAVIGNTVNTTNNGGVPVDYAYGAALALANSQDGVRIQSPDGLTIDETIYRSASISAQNGISRELKNSALDNSDMDNSNWSDALVTAVYGPGGRGTPKAQSSTFAPFAKNVIELSDSANNQVFSETIDSASNDVLQTKLNAGEIVSANIGTIAPGGYAIVTYRVTVADPIPAGVISLRNQATFTGDNFADTTTDDPATGAAGDATFTPLGFAPTSASVNIGGQVVNTQGLPVRNAKVSIIDFSGNISLARTNPFGYYRFENVGVGQTYVVEISAKGLSFNSQVITPVEDVEDLNFSAQ